jgi:ribonuclease P protein component
MKIAPLKGKSAFASTMRSGKRFTEHTITGMVKFRKHTEPAKAIAVESLRLEIALGVSIRKKAAKKATVRNRVKRLLRQSVRTVIREFTDAGYFDSGNPFERVIIFCNSAPTVPSLMCLADIHIGVRAVLQSAYDYSQKHSLAQ